MDISINSALKALIRPLTDTEYNGLEAAILRDGIREPLAVWDNEGKFILLDGHNRKKICDKHNLEYKTRVIKKVTIDGVELDLDSLGRARIWVAHNQAGRRNLDSTDAGCMVAQVVPDFANDTKRRQVEAGEKIGASNAHKPKDLESQSLGNLLPKLKGNKPNEIKDLGKAVVQAIAAIAPGKTNKTYVHAILKDVGYDSKTRKISKPERFERIGSGKGQTQAKDLVKAQRQVATTKLLAEITADNATKLPVEREYTVLYVDCPWRYDFAETDNRKIENQYPTMDVAELCKFKVEFEGGKKKLVGDIAAKNSVIFFWATAPKLREALQVLDAWGFDYKTHAIWDKEKIGMGYWFRGQHELLMVATKGNMPAPGEYARVASIIRAPRGKHSAKPESVYELIEKMYPKAARVEIFSRNEREGWDVVGNQL